MSQANTKASFARLLKDALPGIESKLGLSDIDINLTASDVSEGLSIRLHALNDGPGVLEGHTLFMIALRVPFGFDEWTVDLLKEEILGALGLDYTSSTMQSFQIEYNFKATDTSPPRSGTYTIQVHGSQTWRRTKDTDSSLWLHTLTIKVIFE